MWETQVRYWGQEDPRRRKWQPTPVFLPGESHGRRSLVGYSPQGRKESDTTEWHHYYTMLYSLPVLFDLKPDSVGGSEDNGNSFKRFHTSTAALTAPNPAAGHHYPHLPQRLLDTHGQVWVSLLRGHCSFLLGPGAYKVLFVPSKSLFPQSWVSPGDSMVG